MPMFSTISKLRLHTCEARLVSLLYDAINVMDFSVIEGHRDKTAQNEAFRQGTSRLQWPNSLHNSLPSRAVDIAPYPIDWKDRERFCYLAGIVLGIARARGIKIRWGGDWDGDGNIREHSLQDLPHFELAEE